MYLDIRTSYTVKCTMGVRFFSRDTSSYSRPDRQLGDRSERMFAKFLAHSGCSVNGSNYYHYGSYHYYLLVVGVCQWQSSGKSSFVGTAFLLLSTHFPLLSTHYLLWGGTAHNLDKTNPKPQSGHCHRGKTSWKICGWGHLEESRTSSGWSNKAS